MFKQNAARKTADAECIHLETEVMYRPNRPLFSCFKRGEEWVTALDLFSQFSECNLATLLGKVSGIDAANSGEDFQALVKADANIGAHLSATEIDRVFSLDTYLRNVDTIFDRVFNDG